MAVRDSRAPKARLSPRPGSLVPELEETTLGKGITMWGAPATGKTTLLAALYTALLDQETRWRLRGADENSTDVLVSLTNTLADKGIYPGQTVGIKNYRWSLVGTMPGAVREWRWYGPRRLDRNVVIPLDLVDVAGEVADSSVVGRERTKRYVDHLQNSAGIVFCYDPIREFTKGDIFTHTFDVLTQLDSKMNRRGKLPHHVAVCVTKFDEQRVFDAALRLGMIEYDEAPPCFPRVPGSDAREFFARLCGVSPTYGAQRVLQLLERHFEASRIEFFVTSAIGFYVDRYSGVFNPRDYQQHIAQVGEEKEPRVRGTVRPINVVEPIIWLAEKLARAAGE